MRVQYSGFITQNFKYFSTLLNCMGESVVLTFENLYEVLRKEKNNEDLQKIDDEFFTYVKEYLNEKQNDLKSVNLKSDIFSHKEKENLTLQINNTKKELKELYDRREQKILSLAINKSKTNSTLIDTSSLILKETQLFEKLSETLLKFRDEFLNEQVTEIIQEITEEPIKINTIPGYAKVRFLENVDTFIGRELEEYGPYREEEIAEIPEDLAEILINDEKAIKL